MISVPRTRRLVLRSLAVLGALGARGAARAAVQPVVIRDDRGVQHRFAAPPQRIVTLLPSLTEVATVLGASARLVGVDTYSNWPPEIQRLPHLGGLDDARIEAIAELKPDVVLASTSSRALDRLDALGFAVVRLKSDSHADVRRTLDIVARLLGIPDESARVWGRLERETNGAAARVPRGLRGLRVYFEIDGGPYGAGPTSFIGETLARLGMGNVIPPELGPFPKLNPEYVVRSKPDIIMGARRQLAGLAERPGWRDLRALRDRRICEFDSLQFDVLVRSGPRMGDAAALLADCLVRLESAR